MTNDRLNYKKLTNLVIEFQNKIIQHEKGDLIQIIDTYLQKFRMLLHFDAIIILQTILVGEAHDMIYSYKNTKDFHKQKDYLILNGFIKRQAEINKISKLQLYNKKTQGNSTIIDFEIYIDSIVIPLMNTYKNNFINGVIIFSNKKDNIILDKLLTDTLSIISNTITLAFHKRRLTYLIKRENQFIDASFNTLNHAMCIFDNNGKIIRINSAFSRLTGLTESNVLGFIILDILKLKDHNHISDYSKISDETLEKNANNQNNMYVKYKDNNGNVKILKKNFNNVVYDKIVYNLLVLEDITSEILRLNDINFKGIHDALTGLYNRNFYQDHIRNLKSNANFPLSIIVGDINGLKLMNDIFGHKYGDEILIKIANILKQHCKNGTVLRMGGDEFYIFLENSNELSTKNYINYVNTSCLETFNELTFVGISLGSCTIYNNSEMFDSAIRKAEVEMYYKKSIDNENIKNKSLEKFKSICYSKCENGKSHSTRLVKIARDFGKYLNLRKNDIVDLCNAIEIHDIGKVSIDDCIVNKKEKYDEKEIEIMKTHCSTGYKIATLSYKTAHLSRIILSHHEAWNGSGFPQGLIGNEIPYLAKIISILDYYDILKYGNNNKKPNKNSSEIKNNLLLQKNKMFDSKLVESFINFINSSKKEY